MNWVKLTDADDGKEIFVNLDCIVTMARTKDRRNNGMSVTRLYPTDDHIEFEVQETPEEIMTYFVEKP